MCFSPTDQSIVVERALPSDQELETVLQNAVNAQRQWKKASLEDRIAVGERFIKAFQDLGRQISQDLTVQMGRPTSQGMVEVNGTLERARRMIDLARESLADVVNPVSRTEWIHTVESDIIAGHRHSHTQAVYQESPSWCNLLYQPLELASILPGQRRPTRHTGWELGHSQTVPSNSLIG
jgi:hypothetical protein